jgi:hypothetical protein
VPSPLFDLTVPPELLPHNIDRVERLSAAGRDGSGVEAATPVTVYTDLPALVDERAGGGLSGISSGASGLFGQPAEDENVFVYLARQEDGTLPDIRKRDRLLFGTWPNGDPKYLLVNKIIDELEANVLIVLQCSARRPD